ncbi:MAG: alpha/beta fold hydrolase [Clostridia bacterium]|nr:alpha/beta fold hydrolase [Clostridia bacterium]
MSVRTGEEKFITTERGKIWTETYGPEKSGVPLLVLHGGPGFMSMPQTISELASERPVIFYDQHGCGRSESSLISEEYTVSNYVKELGEIIEKLGLNCLNLMGHSWGAMLAAEYFLRDKPKNVRSIIFSGPLLSVPMWEADQRKYIKELPERDQKIIEEAELRNGFEDASYQEVMMKYYCRHVCRLDPWPEELVNALGEMNREIYLSMWGPSEFTTTGSLKGANLLPRLHEITVPALLICGEHDEASPETILKYRDALDRGEAAVIPDASHCHHIEKPEIFLAVVRDFLKRCG